MSVNDITGDAIKTKAASKAFLSNWDNIQWGNPNSFNPEAECNPLMTECPRCRNVVKDCDDKMVVGKSKEQLARERAIVSEYWEDMPTMFRKLGELDLEYKAT